MQEKRDFNQLEYIKEYNKKHYKAFKVDLKKEELDNINNLLKENNMTKAEFLRLSIKLLKNGKIKKED